MNGIGGMDEYSDSIRFSTLYCVFSLHMCHERWTLEVILFQVLSLPKAPMIP